MAFTEDFTVFFADFSVTATPALGEAVAVIFDRAHIEALGIEVSATKPIALAESADLIDWVPHETQVTINDIDYMVRDVQPDGTGLSLVWLEAV